MNSQHISRQFLNLPDCYANESSVAVRICLRETNEYNAPTLGGTISIRDCGGSISLEIEGHEPDQMESYSHRSITYRDSLHKLEVLIKELQAARDYLLEAKKEYDPMLVAWKQKRKEKEEEEKKKKNEENKTSV